MSFITSPAFLSANKSVAQSLPADIGTLVALLKATTGNEIAGAGDVITGWHIKTATSGVLEEGCAKAILPAPDIETAAKSNKDSKNTTVLFIFVTSFLLRI